MGNENSNRRRFIRKLAKLGAAGGIATLLLGQLQEKKGLIPEVQAQTPLYIDTSNSGSSTTSLTSSISSQAAFDVRNTSGTGPADGVWGRSDSTGGRGVSGVALAASGSTRGVYGRSDSTSGTGVEGFAPAASGSTVGVYGQSSSTSGTGVEGIAWAASGSTVGVYGRASSTSGKGVNGFASASSGFTYGVYGQSDSTSGYGVYGWASAASGIGVMGSAGNAGAKPIVARGWFGQTANLQEWQNSAGTPLSVVDAAGKLGVGIAAPVRQVHLQGNNAVFRMDRDANSSAFILVRTAPGDFNTIWKTFYVGVDASGVNNGEFFIGDVGTAVSGPSAKRLWIDNSGGVHIPNLITGDIALANDFVVTEDEKHGIAFKNDVGEKIAILDRKGNLHIKGRIIQDL